MHHMHFSALFLEDRVSRRTSLHQAVMCALLLMQVMQTFSHYQAEFWKITPLHILISIFFAARNLTNDIDVSTEASII
jgi:hypothetical protein